MARKTYQGEKNNKQRTMDKLVQAVGTVLGREGYTGLTLSKIAEAAGVDRKQISNYFGTVENLVEIYIKGKDYWISATVGAIDALADSKGGRSRSFLEGLLLGQIDELMANEEMQKTILWQLSEKTDIMSHVVQGREQLSSLFFRFSDKEFAGKDIDLRGISSILVAGIYYLVLHSKTTDSTFCEIDIRTEEGMDRIRDAVKTLLRLTYESIEKGD